MFPQEYPKGSLLGPLLFIFYVNDLPFITSNLQAFLYADDSKFLCPIITPSDNLLFQENLNKLTNWSLRSKLEFNVKNQK